LAINSRSPVGNPILSTAISSSQNGGSNNVSRNLKRVFLRIDSLLPSSTSLISETNSPEYYREQMEEAREFIKKLSSIVQQEELSDIHFSEINRCITRLREYVAVIDRIRTSKLEKVK